MRPFNEIVHDEIIQLNERWRRIERLLKKAERVQDSVAIAAINELRYAGRQLFVVSSYFTATAAMAPAQKRSIQRRLVIADQYLKNAEHDIVDALVKYFLKVTSEADQRIGRARITEYFIEYPLFCKDIVACYDLIEETRADETKRFVNYETIYGTYFDLLVNRYRNFLEAEVSARFQQETIKFERDSAQYALHEAELEKERLDTKRREAEDRNDRLSIINTRMAVFGVFTGIATIISIALAVYIWRHTPAEICVAPASLVDLILCRF
ncbi:hypothetical protein [Rhizobium sp. PP-CC-3G-465]|uniref:hypothetical protein n=1 Tax=Rhizobium sp. PP-CC-3G-465 TaxID=2135648 RepID=UPI0010502EC7|nr:hypothetical protein C8J33_11644 [Rhizobium sp. PP-CC-3G-465]